MAITQLSLLGLGVFATLATIGMFFEYGDDWTRSLVGFTAAIAWGFVAVSSFNVLIPNGGVTYQVTLTPIVWFSGGMSIVMFLFTLRLLLMGVKQEAEAASMDAFR